MLKTQNKKEDQMKKQALTHGIAIFSEMSPSYVIYSMVNLKVLYVALFASGSQLPLIPS